MVAIARRDLGVLFVYQMIITSHANELWIITLKMFVSICILAYILYSKMSMHHNINLRGRYMLYESCQWKLQILIPCICICINTVFIYTNNLLLCVNVVCIYTFLRRGQHAIRNVFSFWRSYVLHSPHFCTRYVLAASYVCTRRYILPEVRITYLVLLIMIYLAFKFQT